MLAALDNNFNTGRAQKKTISKKSNLKVTVKNHFRIAYRKPSKKFIARKFYEKKKYDYLREMLEEVRQRSITGVRNLNPTKVKRMAPTVREKSREEMITNCVKYKRFKF